MINNKYIIKNLAPWMMDELLAFSTLAKFDLILLRKQDDFYKESLDRLKLNGVNIYIEPFRNIFSIKKSILILKFLFSNFSKFEFNYNGVIGLKSMYWFFKLDLKHFSQESNLHAQFATQAAIVSILIKKYYSNKPFVSFTFHAYDIYYNNKWFKLLVNNCHKAFSISDFNIHYVKNKYLSSNKIILSRLGVFRNNIKNENKKENSVFTLGLISWFIDKKGVIFLLEALKLLKENGFKNIQFILAGDGPLKEEYLQYIEENDLVDMVNYIGKIKGQEKEVFFNSLDIFILPSIKLKNDQDGIPVVLMEAIAYSLPIISTNISGIPEICINNYNGKLIEEKNVEEIYEAIIDLYTNKNNRMEYGANSFELSSVYDIEINSREKIKLLQWV